MSVGRTNLHFWAKQHLMRGVYDSTDGTRGGCDLDPEMAEQSLNQAWADVDAPSKELASSFLAYDAALTAWAEATFDRIPDRLVTAKVALDTSYAEMLKLAKELTQGGDR